MDKVFIFDMDGVIINSEPIHLKVALEVAEEYGIPLNQERIETFVGMRSYDMWKSIINEERRNLNPIELLEFGVAITVKDIEQSNLEPISGIRHLLEKLNASKYRIALASSSSRVLIDAVLKKFEIDSYFDCIVSGEEVNQGKPAPDIYLEVAKRLAVNPSDCFVLEDSKMGIDSGNMAGMRTIGFTNPSSGNQDLSKAKFVVNSIAEIVNSVPVFQED